MPYFWVKTPMVLSCKCHTFGSKLPWLRGVSAILLGRNSGTLATSDNGQQTTEGGSRWGYAKTTSQQDNEWAVASGAVQGLRRTTDNRQRTTEGGSQWVYAKTTSQLVNETTSNAVATCRLVVLWSLSLRSVSEAPAVATCGLVV